MMCQNCNCDFFDRCSIVGYMPIGFCCENCYLYDEYTTCLKSKTKSELEKEPGVETISEIKLSHASIEGKLLKVIITQKDEKEKTLLIDLKKYLESY
ncbi:MAG: hypothetical protein ACFFAI_02500 [Promethearchaeota archaeon]